MLKDKITEYSKIRRDIKKALDAYGIPNNDNIVGRIGEYYAADYFINAGSGVIFSQISNQAGFDFSINNIRYSVKTITKENNTGSTSPLKLDGSWDYLISVKLGENFELLQLSSVGYDIVKRNLDENSIKQNKQPSVKKSFRWWKFLNDYLIYDSLRGF